MKSANSNIGGRKWSKDCGQVGISRSDNGRARNGVLRDTPPESGRTLVRGVDLSQEIGKDSAVCGGVTLASYCANCSDYLVIGPALFDNCTYYQQLLVTVIDFE